MHSSSHLESQHPLRGGRRILSSRPSWDSGRRPMAPPQCHSCVSCISHFLNVCWSFFVLALSESTIHIYPSTLYLYPPLSPCTVHLLGPDPFFSLSLILSPHPPSFSLSGTSHMQWLLLSLTLPLFTFVLSQALGCPVSSLRSPG